MQIVVELSLDVLFTIAVGEAMIHLFGNCQVHIFVWFVTLGAIQIGLSCLLPDYSSIKWIAVVAAVMSTCYSKIAWIMLVSSTKHPHDANYKPPESPLQATSVPIQGMQFYIKLILHFKHSMQLELLCLHLLLTMWFWTFKPSYHHFRGRP